ncbi:MAG TPA: protein kinase, partial [Vicinamibacterales bacterium]|nr:protein kinase [Vicinamibacterales bacterium]
MSLLPGTTLGPYTIVGPLGAGGMGEVYRAHDGRLGRDVAIKVLPALVSHDPERRARLQREARAIAALNHPHICVIHDVGEQDGLDFIVMELLDGESLAARLVRGPMRFSDAAPIARAILETLAAVHARGLLHRDLKPANIFLTQHGVKLLDFGLARSAEPDQGATAITREGLVLGSPRYMAPEQIRGVHLDHRTDLFAAAVIMYEMLTGEPAFNGSSSIEVAHAIAYEEPAPLQPDAAPPAFQRALRQALEKDPARRPQSAQAFAAALGADSTTTGPREAIAPPGRSTTRLIVVPFRLLRPDPDIDFLGFSLADAVASSLAGFDSLVVRSSLGAVQASPTTDLRALAAQADVDVALLGSLLRVGAQVRVSAQLVEVPGGSILWSRTMQAPVEDLFQLQDTLAHAIVSSLHVPLTTREEGRLRQDVPANAEAYEQYLRANQLMTETGRWPEARELYERAVALDPGYAPAWARLGRVLRVSAKYGGPQPEADRVRAERAFERALALNPDLPMAHHLYTHLEVELGRAADAMVRLLTRARARRPEADVFAGLVTTCRYCGLLDESVAAYEQSKRIDPSVATSVSYTFYLLGDYARTRETDADLHGFPSMLARHRSGDTAGAITSLKALEAHAPYALGRTVAAAYRAALEGEPQAARELLRLLEASPFRDPEGLFLLGGFLAAAGISDAALVALDRGVTGGFHCPRAMRS